MPLPVVTVAAGGLPVNWVSASPFALPVVEAASGIAVTKVTGGGGLPATYVTPAGAIVPPVTYATFDPATVTAVTLSGGNLVATNTGTTSADQGARVATASGKTSGKYYFEVTWTSINNPGGASNRGVGIGTTVSTYTNMGNGGTTGDITYSLQTVYSNGGLVQGAQIGWVNGYVCGMAVDLDNRKIWFRLAPSGNWNYVSSASDPTTNVGGFTIPAGAMAPFVTFGGSGGTANNVMTANFGASAFTGAAPAGFTAGWPA